MEFEPLYFGNRFTPDFKGEKNKFDFKGEKNKCAVINPEGRVGIVTLWAKIEVFLKALEEINPEILKKDSPLAVVTNLYGSGLAGMLANMANNPQITRIAITGIDLTGSAEALMNFFEKGTIIIPDNDTIAKINGTNYVVDSQLNNSLFPYLRAQKFSTYKPKGENGEENSWLSEKNIEEIISFAHGAPENTAERKIITLREPKFEDYPSDIASHQIIKKTPLEAWMEIIYLINRFGQTEEIKKGKRRKLLNLQVIIKNAEFEKPEELTKFGFNPEQLRDYQKRILTPNLPTGQTYNYGNRLLQHFGGNTLDTVVKLLREDQKTRHAFIAIYDTKRELLMNEDGTPCLTDLYFLEHNETLMLTAGFRTHNAVEAWLENAYGLRAIQEHVAEKTRIKPGRIVMNSRYISIDPENNKTRSALGLVEKYRKTLLDVEDPAGYFIVETEGDRIIAKHHRPDGQVLTTYSGKTAEEIKNQIRYDAVPITPDHAIWIGIELALAERNYKLGKSFKAEDTNNYTI